MVIIRTDQSASFEDKEAGHTVSLLKEPFRRIGLALVWQTDGSSNHLPILTTLFSQS